MRSQIDSVNRCLDELHYQLNIKHTQDASHSCHSIDLRWLLRLVHCEASWSQQFERITPYLWTCLEQMQAEADTKLRASIGQDYLGKASHKIVKIDPK